MNKIDREVSTEAEWDRTNMHIMDVLANVAIRECKCELHKDI